MRLRSLTKYSGTPAGPDPQPRSEGNTAELSAAECDMPVRGSAAARIASDLLRLKVREQNGVCTFCRPSTAECRAVAAGIGGSSDGAVGVHRDCTGPAVQSGTLGTHRAATLQLRQELLRGCGFLDFRYVIGSSGTVCDSRLTAQMRTSESLLGGEAVGFDPEDRLGNIVVDRSASS